MLILFLRDCSLAETMNEKMIPVGYCQCGCGQKTEMAKVTRNRRGYKKGEPLLYLVGHNRNNKNPLDKFWKRIKKGKENECWEWQHGKFSTGYGRTVLTCVGIKGKQGLAHRVAWALTFNDGVMPSPKEEVCHKCDNPPCCNPSHLFLGSHKDNMLDAIYKGRLDNRGEQNGKAILTKEEVLEMRRLRRDGMFFKDIAARMGRKEGTVYYAVMGKNWGWLS